MELAKVTTSGQVTIPVQIRKKLGIKEGDKVLFVEDDNRIVLLNASQIALENLQKSLEGEAGKVGVKSEEDVVTLCREVREELYQKRYAGNG